MKTFSPSIELTDTHVAPAVPGILDRIRMQMAKTRKRREERRTIVALSRLDRRRLEDMGFEPDAIYGAVEGTWNEVDDRFVHFPGV